MAFLAPRKWGGLFRGQDTVYVKVAKTRDVCKEQFYLEICAARRRRRKVDAAAAEN